MKIKYLGPGETVNVGKFGAHLKGQIKDYPDEVGKELIETAQKQQFEVVEETVPTEPSASTGYPDEVGKELIGTAQKQQFEVVEETVPTGPSASTEPPEPPGLGKRKGK